MSLFAAGLVHLAAGRILRARRALAQSAAVGGRDAPWAVQELVQIYLARSEAAACEPALRALLPANSPLLAFALGRLYRQTGRAVEAIAQLEHAFAARPRLWASATELGFVIARSGREADGLALLARADRHFTRSADSWGRSFVASYRALLAFDRMDLLRAGPLQARAVALKRLCGHARGLAAALHNQGLVRSFFGDHAGALQASHEALALQRSIRDRRGEALSLHNLGYCHLNLANPGRAEAPLFEALTAFRRLRERHGAGHALGNLGWAAYHRGELATAVRRFRGGLALIDPLSHPDGYGIAVADIAKSYTLWGKPRLALLALERLSGAVEGRANLRTRLVLAFERASALAERGAWDEALVAAEAARRLAGQIPGPQRGLVPQVLDVEAVLARAHLARGRPALAAAIARRAASRLEVLRDAQPDHLLRMGVVETSREIHDAWIVSLIERPRPKVVEAWRVASGLKAHELRAQRRAGPHANAGIAAVEAAIRALVGRSDLSAADLRHLRRLRRTYLEGVDRDRTTPRQAPRTPVIRAPRLDTDLGGREAMVEYHFGRRSGYAFVVRAGRLDVIRIPGAALRLGRDIARLLAPLRRAGASSNPAAELDRFDERLAHRLYRRVFAPLSGFLPADVDSLVIVPHGPLHALPLELLVVTPSRAAGSPPVFLADSYTIAYRPTSRRPAARLRRRGPESFLGVAFSPPPGTVVYGAEGSVAVAPLPGAAQEVRALARRFQRGRTVAGSQATIDTVLAAMRSRDLVHICAHALADATTPALSGVVLAPPAGAARADLLTADRIARTRVGARLVTLAACDTGHGELRLHEGVLGLARSFFAAGAGAVIASLWPVDHAAARALMLELYHRIARGETLAGALAGATRRLRERARGEREAWRQPYFWAPFVLIEWCRADRGGRARR